MDSRNSIHGDAVSQSRTGEFVRGFFIFLEREGIQAAVLHGWQDGFEGELSDVDFAIHPDGFRRIAELVHRYCTSSGWRLCQILRHETTAAFCVCSAMDDPSCVVALDACSDYQRNGTCFFKADELLAGRVLLEWGGWRLDESAELRYRFAKASAKEKDPDAAYAEFLTYSEAAHDSCAAWLQDKWDIRLTDWTPDCLRPALLSLAATSRKPLSFFSPSSLERILARVRQPTGWVVVAGEDRFREISELVTETFSHLYFRRSLCFRSWKPWQVMHLIKSVLVVVPAVPGLLAFLIPQSCRFDWDHEKPHEDQLETIARKLHMRCLHRESIHHERLP